jgi:putative SOS response-associated peptidase YedK
MPGVLEAGQFGAWLNGKLSDALALPKPCPAEVLESWPVSRAVNSVRSECAELIRPIGLPERQVQPSLFDAA